MTTRAARTPNETGKSFEEEVIAVFKALNILIVPSGPTSHLPGLYVMYHPKTITVKKRQGREADFCLIADPGHYNRDMFPGLRAHDTLRLLVEVRGQNVSGSTEDKLCDTLVRMLESNALAANGGRITHTALVLAGTGFSKNLLERLDSYFMDGLEIINDRGTNMKLRANREREVKATVEEFARFLKAAVGERAARRRPRPPKIDGPSHKDALFHFHSAIPAATETPHP